MGTTIFAFVASAASAVIGRRSGWRQIRVDAEVSGDVDRIQIDVGHQEEARAKLDDEVERHRDEVEFEPEHERRGERHIAMIAVVLVLVVVVVEADAEPGTEIPGELEGAASLRDGGHLEEVVGREAKAAEALPAMLVAASAEGAEVELERVIAVDEVLGRKAVGDGARADADSEATGAPHRLRRRRGAGEERAENDEQSAHGIRVGLVQQADKEGLRRVSLSARLSSCWRAARRLCRRPARPE